jgi:cytochrome oxidase assembly protein ShyY1
MLAGRALRGVRPFPSVRYASSSGAGRGGGLGLAFFGSLSAATFGLGIWQTARYFEKYEMTEQRVRDLEGEAVDVWEAVADLESPKDVPARRVQVTGRFDNQRTITVGPRPPPKDFPKEMIGADTAGFLVVSPFVDEHG